MTFNSVARSLGALALVAACVGGGYATSAIAEKPEAEAAPAKRLRLPNYYSGVVSNEQREKIHTIQQEFASQIEAKKAELRALVAKRDKAIEGVLSPEQVQVVEKLRAEAAAKRKARAKANAEAKSKAKEAG